MRIFADAHLRVAAEISLLNVILNVARTYPIQIQAPS